MSKNHRIAADLRNLFGVEAGKRLTLAEVARNLSQRSVYVNRETARNEAFDLMWNYEAVGLVENSPGPRGGAGWKLSAKGATLIARLLSNPNAG